jgi:hypothetical protein
MSFGSDRSRVGETKPTVCLIDADCFRIALSRMPRPHAVAALKEQQRQDRPYRHYGVL